jgi:hypothetical protein
LDDIMKSFHKDMINIYHRAKMETGYNATRYLQMLVSHEASLLMAKKFVTSSRPSDGFTELWQRGRLELTVEALVLESPKYRQLFTDEEIISARKRLQECGYSA